MPWPRDVERTVGQVPWRENTLAKIYRRSEDGTVFAGAPLDSDGDGLWNCWEDATRALSVIRRRAPFDFLECFMLFRSIQVK